MAQQLKLWAFHMTTNKVGARMELLYTLGLQESLHPIHLVPLDELWE